MRGLAPRSALLLWSAIAIAAMAAVGWAVGKRSTPLDDWFHHLRHSPARRLLFFTDPWMLTIVLMFGIAAALFLGRRRLAVVMAAAPLIGIVLAQVLKPLFGRRSGESLAYPSGHTTAVVTVTGMLVLVAGAAWWAVAVAAVVSVLGAIGQAVTYHYFTDTLGALLLGSAVVCIAAVVANLTGVNPVATQITSLDKLKS